MEELRTCPFCGGEAKFEIYGGTACAVVCQSCHCGTPTVSLNEGERTVEAWNRRYERTYRMGYDQVHCDYVCKSCGERYETDMYISISGDDRHFFKPMRYCPNCGARVMDE